MRKPLNYPMLYSHSMRTIVSLYKKRGETPLRTIDEFKKKHPEYEDITLSYAGRLDPMAEGLLLVLIGEENKKRKTYENLEKVYEFTLLPGITTDTYDVLGKITGTQVITHPQKIEAQLLSLLPKYTGRISQSYPPYSSKPVNGKPLYYWARENKLAEISIPEKVVTIHEFTFLKTNQLTANQLRAYIVEGIKAVIGDFRQKEILDLWDSYFSSYHNHTFSTYTFRVSCSGGTYIRSLVDSLGKELAVGAIALKIKRVQIGTSSVYFV